MTIFLVTRLFLFLVAACPTLADRTPPFSLSSNHPIDILSFVDHRLKYVCRHLSFGDVSHQLVTLFFAVEFVGDQRCRMGDEQRVFADLYAGLSRQFSGLDRDVYFSRSRSFDKQPIFG